LQKTSRPTGKRGYCFIMTMLVPIQSDQPWREFKNYSGNFLNIRFPVGIWPVVTSICLVRQKEHFGGKHFTDDEELVTEVWKWLRPLLCFYAADLDVLVKQWLSVIMLVEDM
jgi:hypothetical protein